MGLLNIIRRMALRETLIDDRPVFDQQTIIYARDADAFLSRIGVDCH
jgi:hypothetical protein